MLDLKKKKKRADGLSLVETGVTENKPQANKNSREGEVEDEATCAITKTQTRSFVSTIYFLPPLVFRGLSGLHLCHVHQISSRT